MTLTSQIKEILELADKANSGDFFGAHEALKREAGTMAALIKTLSEAICILPDDADVQAGDIARFDKLIDAGTPKVIRLKTVYEITSKEAAEQITREMENIEIIQRNKLPVIYESQLEGGV
jgi:hypothetical protein